MRRWRKAAWSIAAALLLASLPACSSSQEKAADAALAGARALEAENYAEARRMMMKAVSARDDVAEYWVGLGRAELGLRRFSSAYEAYLRALELDRSNVEALQMLTDLSVMFNLLDKAAEYADQMLLLNPQDVRPKLAKGAIALRRKRNQEALALAEQILKADPAAEPALILRAKAQAAMGRPRPAAEQLELAMRVRGSTPLILEALVELYGASRDREGLQRTYARLAQAKPDDAEMLIDYARELYRGDRGAEALAVIERLQQSQGANPAVAERIVDIWLQPGMQPVGSSDVRRLAAGAAPAMRAALARYAIESGRPGEALPLLAPLTEGKVSPQSAYAAALLADAQHRLGRSNEALGLSERVLEIEKTSPRALLVRAAILIDRKEYRRALADARVVMRDNPRMPEGALTAATAYAGLGERNLEGVTYRRAYSDFPSNPDVIRAYVAYLAKHEGAAAALAVATESAARNPGSAEAQRLRSDLCRRNSAPCGPAAGPPAGRGAPNAA